MLRIHVILGWIRIRIRGSMPLTNGSVFGFGSESWIRILKFSSLTFKMSAKNKFFNTIFSAYDFLKLDLHNFSKIKIQKDSQNSRPDPDPEQDPDQFLWLVDPDPGGPKTRGSGGSGSGFGSGSATLDFTLVSFPKKLYISWHRRNFIKTVRRFALPRNYLASETSVAGSETGFVSGVGSGSGVGAKTTLKVGSQTNHSGSTTLLAFKITGSGCDTFLWWWVPPPSWSGVSPPCVLSSARSA